MTNIIYRRQVMSVEEAQNKTSADDSTRLIANQHMLFRCMKHTHIYTDIQSVCLCMCVHARVHACVCVRVLSETITELRITA